MRIRLIPAIALLLMGGVAAGQDSDRKRLRLEVKPKSLDLKVGDQAKLEARLLNAAGTPQKADILFFSRSRRSVRVNSKGEVSALRPGKFTVVVRASWKKGGTISANIPVTVAYPPLARVEILDPVDKLYAGTTLSVRTRVVDTSGAVRTDAEVRLSSSAPGVVSIDDFGHVTALKPGAFTLYAKTGKIGALSEGRVVANPVASIELNCDRRRCRTGDVLRFTAVTRDAAKRPVKDAPVFFSFTVRPDDDLGPSATGQIEQDGRFVAEAPGLYTIVASCGGQSARHTVRAVARNVRREIKLVGHGKVQDVHTSDLWVWEGKDKKDYAVTGTWGANGEAIFWDVTDPSKIKEISRIKVDARTVNDVKVSEDGTLCIISREGASNRRNGLVLIDVRDPRKPKIISTFDKNLTGGVHNLFIYRDHVYALSAGRRYDIISIKDPTKPSRVGTFELGTPGHSIHDVWIENGLAYSSNWADGVQIVDVGNGIAGGSAARPVRVGSYAYPSGRNHAAFPYRDQETGKFYVIAGDEAFPYGLHKTDRPSYPRGYFHFIDFTDVKNPREVARYEVPEAGSHNLWVDGDTLYLAYYNAGVRVVDISGELMGNLYNQGREIAWYLPSDHKGKIPNAPFVWGPQPHKGILFFSDWNSGLWAVKLGSVSKARGTK